MKIDYIKSNIIDDLIYKCGLSRRKAEQVYEAIARGMVGNLEIKE